MNPSRALLTPAEMYRADALAVKAGVPPLTLMENAGRAVAGEIVRRFGARPVTVLAGPGNNGGDGFVAARYLRGWGWPVDILSFCRMKEYRGDAAHMAALWGAESKPLSGAKLRENTLIIDALFGAGLSKPLPPEAMALAREAARMRFPVVAIDVPSGLDGATGKPLGDCFQADLTVTFFRKKPGHVLAPGRFFCGETVVADIGIPASVLAEIDPKTRENGPPELKKRSQRAHKYTSGHAVIVSGDATHTGAARLAAMAALRIGAGLVTLVSPANALITNASHLTAIMLSEADDAPALARLLQDRRKNAVCVGPAAGVGEKTAEKTIACLESGAAVVLDADALTSFAETPNVLFKLISKHPHRGVVLTPHEGEFARLFKDLADESESKLERARKAAERSGAVMVLKGSDTVIAAPDGLAAVNTNAPPSLATAGSGDVLAGIITGLLACEPESSAFEMACAGVWIHGQAARRLPSAGLIAEDLPAAIPAVLSQ
ncbi:MAG: NAD(P)H-hydrate dehydratase [Rhizobiales bacterium]|nr:NAD(P)H-hydrate dehydratase [Hyphomicrobiales bacterium]